MGLRQEGAVLIVSLIVLLIMMLVAVSSVTRANLDGKMASNELDYKRAFWSAEMGLRQAERWLEYQDEEISPSDDGTMGIWTFNAMDPVADNGKHWWQERGRGWWQAHARLWPAMEGIKMGPYTIIEYQYFVRDSLESGAVGGRVYYQITARATGGSDKAVALLQSTVMKRY